MPVRHDVASGDHLALLAARAGIGDVRRILDHGENSALASRPHPAILEPGEVVVIPDFQAANFTIASGKIHKFVFRRLTTKLKITFKTFRGGPTVATDNTVAVGDAPEQPLPLSAGAFEVETKPTDTAAIANVPAPGNGQPDLVWRLRLGALGRAEGDEGAFARLRNLGYYRTVPSDADERERKSAIEEFQVDQDMKPTGQLDAATRDKLVEAYGC